MTFKTQSVLCVCAAFCIACGKQVRKAEVPTATVPVLIEEEKLPPAQQTTVTEEKPQMTKGLKAEPPKISKAAKKKKGRFNFSGDEFVKESGLNPFEKKNDTIIRLRGHAKVSSKNLRMASPQIEIYGDDGRIAYAKGPVEIIDTRDDTRITADEALFVHSENRAIIRGNARLVAKVKSGKKAAKKSAEKITLTAAEMERNFETSVSTARGNVVATSANGVLYAHKAEFVEREDLMRSESQPRIFTASDLFLARSIQWNIATNTAEFRGDVRAYFSRPESSEPTPGRKPSGEQVDAAIRSEEGTLVQRDDLPHGQRLTLRKKVSIERKNYAGYSEEAEIYGSGGELVKAKDHVILVNREDHSKSYGDFLEWVKDTGFMSLTARKNSRTRTILSDKKAVPTAEILASSVTRTNVAAHPQARGNVQIIQFAKEKGSNPVRMGGEWAEMRRSEKIIQLYGSPYVEGELGRIGARDIILYYEDGRYEMLGIRPGVVEKRMNHAEESYE